MVQQVREVLPQVSIDHFPVYNPSVTPETVSERLVRYESIIQNLQTVVAIIAYWGGPEHISVLRKAPVSVAEHTDSQGGSVAWSSLRWYPALLLEYTIGIAAIAADKYDALSALFTTEISSSHTDDSTENLVWAIGKGISKLDDGKLFNQLPGYEHFYVARSEYLFKFLQPVFTSAQTCL